MKHVYFNSYPTAHKEINTDQSLNIQCMKDFDEAIQAAGLIRTTEPNQLDLDNVPNIILVDHRKTNTGYYDIAYEYQPLIYTFNDELNSEYPLYLKFYFHYASITGTSPTAKTSFDFILGCQLEIVDNKKNILTDKTFIGIRPYATSAITSGNYLVDAHNKSKSVIHNIDNKLLSINICPWVFYKMVNSSANTLIYGINSTQYMPLMHFIFRRYENGDYLFISNNNAIAFPSLYSSTNPLPTGVTKNIPTILYNNIPLTNSIFTQSFVYMNDFYNSKKVYGFPLEYYVYGSEVLVRDELLLVGHHKTFPEAINGKITLKLDDQVEQKYYPLSSVYSCIDFGSSNITLLVAYSE